MTTTHSHDATRTPAATTGRILSRTDDTIELGLPDTDYRLHLKLDGASRLTAGQRVTGVLRAKARRVDVMGAGGRFIEPVFGRPRRVQGRIVGADAAESRLFVDCGAAVFVCELTDARQHVGDFAAGQIVGFDVEAGTKLEI